MGALTLGLFFQNTHRIKSLFPYKDRLNRSQMSKELVFWDCQDFYFGKTKRRLHDRKLNTSRQSSAHHQSKFPHFQSQQRKVLDSSYRHYSAFMSMHTFASIGASRIHLSKLTIMLLFCPFHSDDAFCILLLEVKAIISNGH